MYVTDAAFLCIVCVKGTDFQYTDLGKAIPPPKDRLPSGGNYKEMPEGVQAQPAGDDYDANANDQTAEAQEYVQELMEKASSAAGAEEEEEEEEAY